MGVEPINDGIARHPPVLKTGTITGPHALPWQANATDFGNMLSIGINSKSEQRSVQSVAKSFRSV
jgi:hypothetical protein